jgi:sulfite exporter TauE/SafE
MFYWTAFVLGLAGSIHCAGMCGPLAVALPWAGRGGAGFVLGRVAYNLGRVATYCALGILFGLFGKTFLMAGIQRWLSIGLGLVLFAGLFATGRLTLRRPLFTFVAILKSRMAALLQRRSILSSAMLGLLNGILPCGLVYVASAGAASTGGVLSGIAYMATFGLGTLPLMLAIGLSGKLAPRAFRLKLQKAVPVSVILVASLLILRGLSLGIPYVSPVLTGAHPSCCHR